MDVSTVLLRIMSCAMVCETMVNRGLNRKCVTGKKSNETNSVAAIYL